MILLALSILLERVDPELTASQEKSGLVDKIGVWALLGICLKRFELASKRAEALSKSILKRPIRMQYQVKKRTSNERSEYLIHEFLVALLLKLQERSFMREDRMMIEERLGKLV